MPMIMAMIITGLDPRLLIYHQVTIVLVLVPVLVPVLLGGYQSSLPKTFQCYLT